MKLKNFKLDKAWSFSVYQTKEDLKDLIVPI